MTTILSDLRLALRGLRRSPLFATVAILSLALGLLVVPAAMGYSILALRYE